MGAPFGWAIYHVRGMDLNHACRLQYGGGRMQYLSRTTREAGRAIDSTRVHTDWLKLTDSTAVCKARVRRGPDRREDTRRWPALAPALDHIEPDSAVPGTGWAM